MLNISPGAIGNLLLGNDAVTFNARFSGNPFALYIPQRSVLAIYARENGAGTMFTPEEEWQEDELDDADTDVEEAAASDSPEPGPDDDKPKKGSHLRVVK